MMTNEVTRLSSQAGLLCCLGLASVALLAGCGGGGGGGSSKSTTTTTPPTTSVKATAADGLVATLAESSATVAVGGTVTYTLTLTNNTGVAVAINATSATPTTPSTSLIVVNSSGQTVYEPIPGAPPLFSASLASGQSLTTTVAVATYPSAGAYKATAVFDNPTVPVTVGPLAVTVP